MTGPEHYCKAEHLLDATTKRLTGNDAEWLQTPGRRAELRAEAQVHATLALAAATALNDHGGVDGGMPVADWNAWRDAAGVKAEATA